MIKNFLNKTILEHFSYSPTEEQGNLINKLCDFLTIQDNESVFILKGYAGTGKTSIMSAFVKSLKEIKTGFTLLAPTGRAAKVLTSISGFPAFTIHKTIYRQKKSGDIYSGFGLGFNNKRDHVFVVDEASMINNEYSPNSIFGTGRLLTDLLNYIFSRENCKLILIGDTAQLPPVNSDLSPALDPLEYKSHNLNVQEFELTQVIRQVNDSGILMNATYLRNKLISAPESFPELDTEPFDDIIKIGGNEIVDTLEQEYDKYGMDEVKVICRSNKQANVYNKGIRSQILWREEELEPGDLLMVVKNNYMWLPENSEIDFIANGDMLKIIRIKKYYEIHDLRFQDVIVNFVDYPDLEVELRIMLDCLDINAPALPPEDNKEFFSKIKQDYPGLKGKDLFKALQKDPFLNALQVKYAYAFTCHKSQGGQWSSIFIDQAYVNEEMLGKSYYRWLYTAITRATKNVFLINFPKEFIK